MALDSFRRDFGLADASPTHRDTVQGNIVSTFQVNSEDQTSYAFSC